ncbi:hypothetical protein [Mesorhizobium sp. DCY119]|nr:hypothetical protein [Mesorhizobium sp. DCY119]
MPPKAINDNRKDPEVYRINQDGEFDHDYYDEEKFEDELFEEDFIREAA